ncbi:MAG: B12-binding domain-containing radical SAM protein [Myxococcaceae bacterium]
MKALLVWPHFSSFSFWNFEKVCELTGTKYMTPPLGLLTVAALLPKDWEIRVVDENVRPLVEADYTWSDIVLVSSKIVHRKRALDVVREAKRHGKPVAVGGPDPTLSHEVYANAGADYLCLDEGEATLPMMLSDLAKGVKQGLYRAKEAVDLSKSPVPRFDLIDHRDYLYIGLQYSRGCPHNCEFCNVIDLFDHTYRTKTLEQVLAEFQMMYDLGYRGQLDFFDDNLVGNVIKAKPFLKGLATWLKEHNYPFILSTSVTLNIAKDAELLGLFREARFNKLLVGIETPDEKALKTAQKPQNMGFSVPEALDRIYRLSGCSVHSGFLLGMDNESEDIAEQIIKCVDEGSVSWVMAGVVYPLPGTQMSKRLDREGRLFPAARRFDDENVRDQISAGVCFKPTRPSAKVIQDLVRVLKHSYDPEQYFKRCAEAAVRLNCIPNLFPGWRMFFRNARSFMRLNWIATKSSQMRTPYWKAFWKVLFKHPAGVESLVTLAVLFTHFNSMLPYCYEQLDKQLAAIAEHGEDKWLEQNLREPSGQPRAAPAAVSASA